MNKALLVEIHILCAQKWAGGHTVPSRYGCVHEHLQLYKRNNYVYVNVIIYVYIRTHRWLYVVITTKVRYFLVRYFINTALLVGLYILNTTYMAPGHTVPGATMLSNAYTIKNIYVISNTKIGIYHFRQFINTVVCEEFLMRNA